MKNILYRIGKRWHQKYCKHEDKTEVFICYQDRYYHDKCNNCNKEIFTGMD